MVKILLTLLFANSLIAHDSNEHHADGGIHHSPTTSEFNENPTAPYDYFANFEGNYTDTDGDGMTDVAEQRYNFNPYDPKSRPVDIGYFYEQGSHIGIVDSQPTGSPDDLMYFRFNNWPEDLENQYKDIIVHLMPLLFRMVGEPANKQIIDIYNRGKGSVSSWTVSNKGKTMMASEWYNPKMFIHELLHAWKGKYTFTNKGGSSDTSWRHTKDTAGFEEGSADGLTIEIIHEFIDCYPNHQMSKFCTSSVQSLRTGTTSTFDFSHGDQFMSGGNLWHDPSSIHHRYAVAGDTFRILTAHDEFFMRKALDNYYAKIDADIKYRPSAENLIEVFAEVLPEVNGVDTKKFLENLPWMSGKNIPNQLHIANMENHQGWGGGQPSIYPAFANKNGKTYQYYAKRSSLENHGLPTWLKYYEDSNGYMWPDHMNQPFEVKINTIFGELVDTINETTSNNYDSNGKPRDLGRVRPATLARSNWPVGLYKQTITFTEYAKHTEHASTDSYFFGYENFSQDKAEFVIILGVDCEVAEKVVFRLNDYHQTSEIVNGCAVFRTNKIPTNSKFIVEFDVFDLNGSQQTYKRAVIKSAYTRDMYLQHSYVVVDRDFNGIEDIYEENVDSLKNPNHLKYQDVLKNSHPMVESMNGNLHNNVKVTLESNGILLSSEGADRMYVFDQTGKQIHGLTNKSSGETKIYLLDFDKFEIEKKIHQLKVRTIKKVNGKNANSPLRIFNVQEILDGKSKEDKDFEFVDENFVHNATDLNITSVVGGIKLTWKLFENEIPKIVLHNRTSKIADRKASGFVIDYEKLQLNGTEEISAYFEVLDKTEKQFFYRTKEFTFKLSDFKSAEEIEKDKLIQKYTRLVDNNNLPMFDVAVHYNGIQFDFNTTENEIGVLNIINKGRSSDFLEYDKFNLKGDEVISLYVEFFTNKVSNKETMIVTDKFDLDLSIFLSEYLTKKNAMETKFAVYADENGSTKCTITPHENGGVFFEWDDAEGLVSTFAVFKNGEFLTSKSGGSMFLSYKELKLNGTETINVRHAVKTLTGERVFYSSSTFIDLNDHKFVPESKWNDEFFSFVDENNNPKFEIVNSRSYNEGIAFKVKNTENFIGLLFVTHGGRDARCLLRGDHPRGFGEFNLKPTTDSDTFKRNPNIELSIMVFDKLGYREENFHWESNVVIIDTTSYQTTKKDNTDNSAIDDNNTKITKDPPFEDYHTTIAALKKQTKDLSALLKKFEEELSEKNETLSKKQSIIHNLGNRIEDLQSNLNKEIETKNLLKVQNDNIIHNYNSVSYELDMTTKQLQKAIQVARVPFINGWIYDPQNGWLFTNANLYPMVYSHKVRSWNQFELGSSNPRYFFNHRSQKREAWDALPKKNNTEIAQQ